MTESENEGEYDSDFEEPEKTLHDFARAGDIEGVQRLLDQGHDINEMVCTLMNLFFFSFFF
jgi:hypothetical protein